MPKLIGTAGHVDHGKTSLIRALTGIDADRLPEEKRRGLTIDIGFAHLDIPSIGEVSIIDVPGHERFLANMLVGALGTDVAILCVAADSSVMPQTIEHLQILDLLPVQTLVVALTRSDLVDKEIQDVSTSEIRDELKKTRFCDAAIVPVSSVTGDGLDILRDELSRLLQAEKQVRPGPWYLPIDRVFNIKGHGSVVTGTMMAGQVNVGDVLDIEPGSLKARIRQIQSHDETKNKAEAGQRTALNLSGARSEELYRGQIAGQPGTVFETIASDVSVRWLHRPKHGQRVRVSIGSDEVVAKAFLDRAHEGIAQIRFERPTAAVTGQPVIIRNYSPPNLLGGGSVLVPVAQMMNRPVIRPHANSPEAIVEYVDQFVHGLPTEDICREFGRTPQSLGDDLERLRDDRRLIGFAGLWFTPTTLAKSAESFLSELSHQHDRDSSRLLFPREQIAKLMGVSWHGKPFDRLMSFLAEDRKIKLAGTMVGLIGRAANLNQAQRNLLNRVVATMDEHGINVPNPHEVSRTLGVPQQAIDAVLRLGSDAGEVVRLDETVWYSQSALSALIDNMREEMKGEPFTAADFRDKLKTSRKYAIPLLEYFDSIGVTVRRGDTRSIA